MNNKTFADYIVNDLLGDISGIRVRQMFGGFGLYKDKTFIGIIDDGQLFLKVNDHSRVQYQNQGSRPFSYQRDGEQMIMNSYWLVPDTVLEHREKIVEWVLKSSQLFSKTTVK